MVEAIATKHPDYLGRMDEWRIMRDTIRGETAVKEAGTTYLPQPGGFSAQADGGKALYAAYQTRARVPEIVMPAVLAMTGVIHQTEIDIEMPTAMQGLWERATADGLPLEVFHRRITAELLSAGRYAVLVDASSGGGTQPWLAGYRAESLINWAEDRSMFVLDESGLVRDGFTWEEQERYLALLLENGRYVGRRYDGAGNEIDGSEAAPETARRETLNEVPLVVIGPRELSLHPETPPLIGVARAAIAMYQLSADHRWQLFMAGQETLVIINGEAPDTVGSGVVISLNGGGDGNPPDAKYVGPSGRAIEAQRNAIQDERQNAAEAGAQLFNTGTKAAESGDALRVRYAAETASLISIAHASCAGLEKALRHAARMMGENPEKVVVSPPRTLVESEMTPEAMGAIMGLWEKGLISGQTAYENLQDGHVASPERGWDEERKLIDTEDVGIDETRDALLPDPAAE